jgi:hypothetical protein
MSVIEHLQTQTQLPLCEVRVNMQDKVIVHDAKGGD